MKKCLCGNLGPREARPVSGAGPFQWTVITDGAMAPGMWGSQRFVEWVSFASKLHP